MLHAQESRTPGRPLVPFHQSTSTHTISEWSPSVGNSAWEMVLQRMIVSRGRE